MHHLGLIKPKSCRWRGGPQACTLMLSTGPPMPFCIT